MRLVSPRESLDGPLKVHLTHEDSVDVFFVIDLLCTSCQVLHQLLEKPTVSFVGLSNWQLDSAKMNRMVVHMCPDHDKTSLEQTARAILEGDQAMVGACYIQRIVEAHTVGVFFLVHFRLSGCRLP